MSSRGLISALLLLVQLLGLGHVALSSHAVNAEGAVIEREELTREAHARSAEHLCDTAVHVRAPGDDCPVVASWSAPGLLVPAHRRSRVTVAAGQVGLAAAEAGAPLELLFVAPKASPPPS